MLSFGFLATINLGRGFKPRCWGSYTILDMSYASGCAAPWSHWTRFKPVSSPDGLRKPLLQQCNVLFHGFEPLLQPPEGRADDLVLGQETFVDVGAVGHVAQEVGHSGIALKVFQQVSGSKFWRCESFEWTNREVPSSNLPGTRAFCLWPSAKDQGITWVVVVVLLVLVLVLVLVHHLVHFLLKINLSEKNIPLLGN